MEIGIYYCTDCNQYYILYFCFECNDFYTVELVNYYNGLDLNCIKCLEYVDSILTSSMNIE